MRRQGNVRPTGTAQAPALRFYNYIREYYPQISVDLFLEPVPEKFLFLKNSDQIQGNVQAAAGRTYDLFIALDAGIPDVWERQEICLLPPGGRSA